MASVYSESIDFISGLMPENLPFTYTQADEGASIFNEIYWL